MSRYENDPGGAGDPNCRFCGGTSGTGSDTCENCIAWRARDRSGRKSDVDLASLWERLDGEQREALVALCEDRKVRQFAQQRHYDALQKLRLIDHLFELLPLGRRLGAYGKVRGESE